MASGTPSRPWARVEDWEMNKELITRLYWEDDRPLKEVAQIMKYQHGFNATEKMYKARVKKWGLTKYFKAGKMNEACKNVSNGKASVPVIHGRVVGQRKLKQELSGKSPAPFGQPSRANAILPQSSPLIIQVDTPWQFKNVESCLTAVRDFSQSRFQARQWDPATNRLRTDNSATWQNQVLTGYATIRNGKVKEGFRMIDICLKNYKSLIQQQHPLIIIETYTTLLYLSLHRSDLAETILRYLAGLCRVCVGPSHPFSRIWTSLVTLGLGQLRQAAAAITKSQLAMLTTYFKPDADFLLNQRVDIARQTHCFGHLSIEEAQADIAVAIDMKQRKGQSDMLDYVCWAKEMLAYIFKHNKRYAEADAILDEVWKHIECGDVDKFETHEYFSLRCQIALETGTPEEYKALLREKLRWAVKAVGTSHHWTMSVVTMLDAEYGKENDVVASAKLHEEFDFKSNWDVICEEMDNKIQPLEEQS